MAEKKVSVNEKTVSKKPAKPAAEEKPAAKAVKTQKPAAAAKTAAKTGKPATTAKTAAKTEKPAKKPAAKPVKDAPDMVYHISKRKEDRKWQVKAEGAAKALKLFWTQDEAIDYAKSVAGNQEGRIVIHKEDGSFRKLKY